MEVLCKALEEITMEKQYQEKCLLMLVHALQSFKDHVSGAGHNSDAERVDLFSKYQMLVSSVLMATLPRHFSGIQNINECAFAMFGVDLIKKTLSI